MTYGERSATGGESDPNDFTHAWHQTVIEGFASTLTEGKSPMVSGKSALRAHAVISAMEQASKSKHRKEIAAI